MKRLALVLFLLATLATPAALLVGPTEASIATFSQVSAGYWHTCGVGTDGTLACWGRNANGQAAPPAGTFGQVSAGYAHTCGVRTDGTVACWGYNGNGQAAPPAGTFSQVSAGYAHTCGVGTDGTLACWGSNGNGEATPPTGTFSQVSAGVVHTCAVGTDGTLACWGSNANGQAAPPAGTFGQVSAGGWHTCGVGTDGTLACWGSNGNGEATPPAGTFSQVSAGYAHTCGVGTDGTLACWGRNIYGQATPPAGTFSQVSAGGGHTCAVRTVGTLACWGDNFYGQATPPTGTIVVVKATDPPGGTGFGFTDNIAAPNSFSLDDGGTKTFSNVFTDSYTVIEDDPQMTPGGFPLTRLTCTDPDGGSSVDLAARKATIDLDAGETVTCTFTNTPHFLTLPFVVWPYYVVDGWGEYTGGCGGSTGAHWGIDYGAEAHAYLDCWQLAEDTPIVAAGDGEAMASSGGGYGDFVLIWHGNGYSTLYAHLDRYADVFDGHVCPDRLNCNDWVPVQRGRVVGYAGQSGTFYRHLHFEAAKNAATDPVSRYAEHTTNKIDPYDISVPGNIQDRDHYPDADSPSESCGSEHLWQNCPPTFPGHITLADLAQLVEPLAEKWLALDIPSLLRLVVTVLWQGSDIDVTLISPTGRTITCPTADPDVVCDQSPTSTTITVHTPEVGDWTVRLLGADVPPEGEQVSTVATGEPIPIPVAVGGIAELPDMAGLRQQGPTLSSGGPGWSAVTYVALAGGLAATGAITGAAWYARRRWLR